MLRTARAIFILIWLAAALPAAAQNASTWSTGLHSAARLLAGSAIEANRTRSLRAGVEIRLDPGWHTYWRVPGDSGVPPIFDFSGSENVKAVKVLWPAPERFPDGAGGHSIGYTRSVIFPLLVVPNDAARSSLLHLKLGYAACEKLCVPENANLHITLPAKIGTNDPRLADAESLVPRRVPLGIGSGLAIRSVHSEPSSGSVAVEVTAQEGAPVDLFVEGPTPEWSLLLPRLIGSDAGTLRFTFALDSLPPGQHIVGAPLTITAVSPEHAIEVVTHVK